ncbi:hypothetical protein ACA910_015013 [Epithemia clementina (nom. ined.)]
MEHTRTNSTTSAPKKTNRTSAPGKNSALLSLYFVYLACGFATVSLFLAFSADDHHMPHNHHSSSLTTTTTTKTMIGHHKVLLDESKSSLSQQQKKRFNMGRNSKQAEAAAVPNPVLLQNKQPEFKTSSSSSSSLNQNEPQQSLAGLSCMDHGGPLDESATNEMVYWKDIASDNTHVSPFYAPHLYLTFEPDHGGFNNIRMAMETVVALAYAMGRTLVLPPAQKMYLLGQDHFSFADFFDLSSLHAQHQGLDIITTEEFLQRQIQQSEENKHDKDDKDDKNSALLRQLIPASRRTNWDGSADDWFAHVRAHAKNLVWDPNRCIAYFPSSTQDNTKAAVQRFHQAVEHVRQKAQQHKFQPTEAWNLFVGHPTPANASETERLQEFYANRETLCFYNTHLQQEPLLHFSYKPMPLFSTKDTDDSLATIDRSKWEPRLLVHFYAFLFFADYHQDLWMKRLVRDHLRYNDDIQCAAARVVQALRHQVRTVHGRADGRFQSMHVRRGDFQYKVTRVSAEELYQQTQGRFQEGDVVFVATDQRDKSFFAPLEDHYRLYYLDDFIVNDGSRRRTTWNVTSVIGPELNSNFYGMIDQLVASRGHLFMGCWFSTFTGYINRLRGYHSQITREPGYEEGQLLTSFYYAPADRFHHMGTYYPIKQSFYAREFPTAWTLIDQDVVTTTTNAMLH